MKYLLIAIAPEWPEVVLHDRALSMCQIELNCILMLNWIVWKRKVYILKMDLALNNLQWLICHKTKSFFPFFFSFHFFSFVFFSSLFLFFSSPFLHPFLSFLHSTFPFPPFNQSQSPFFLLLLFSHFFSFWSSFMVEHVPKLFLSFLNIVAIFYFAIWNF